jgi:protein TonB
MTLVRSRSDRIKAAAGAALFELALAYVLVSGLAVGQPHPASREIPTIGLLPPPPRPPKPPRPPEPHRRTPEREGAASPANLRATPTEIVRPPPPIPIPVPPPILAAPVAGLGSAASAGAAPVPGPGTGSGGTGNGTGSGNGGNGTGGGGNGGSPPNWLKGEIRDRDYPRSASRAGIGGTVEVTFRVDTDGRARECFISHTSGNRDLDVTTCELIEQRFRYRPARDRSGRPVAAWLVEIHEWVIDPVVPDDDRDR